jgi:hypothetical protein
MKERDIKSIGWLNCADGSINLTPCVAGSTFPIFVNISRFDFEKVRGDIEAMKKVAVQTLNHGGSK